MEPGNYVLQAKVKGGKIVADAPQGLAEGSEVIIRITRNLSVEEKLQLIDEMQSKIVPGPSIPKDKLRREHLYEDRL